MNALEETADFLETLAVLFQNSTGRLTCAYIDVFMKLLDPIAMVFFTLRLGGHSRG
jgi:hypothetical protein